jgi:hypothetical protein
VISHRRPPRSPRAAVLLITAAIAAFWHGAATLNHWSITGACLLAGAALALTLDTPEEPLNPMAEDAVIAAADLVGRSGGRELEIGYLHDDVPIAEAGWYAKVTYRGDRIIVEDQPSPAAAAEALAQRILTGARCTHCHSLVALSDRGAVAYVSDVPGAGGRFVDGTTWTAAQAHAAGQCQWRRIGRRWARGCEDTQKDRPRPVGPNRAERRRQRGGRG